jgi:hypothetical protein
VRTLAWTETALNELAALWMAANSADRSKITKACAKAEHRLLADPEHQGESRSDGLRIAFVSPLALTYHFDPTLDQVTVARIRSSKSRKSPE